MVLPEESGEDERVKNECQAWQQGRLYQVDEAEDSRLLAKTQLIWVVIWIYNSQSGATSLRDGPFEEERRHSWKVKSRANLFIE